MPNLTLSIDEELLRRARIRAAKENTSVNAVVRDYLATYAGARQMSAARRRFVELSRSSSSGSGSGGRSWSRGELHER
jgi:plasmid stability protein